MEEGSVIHDCKEVAFPTAMDAEEKAADVDALKNLYQDDGEKFSKLEFKLPAKEQRRLEQEDTISDLESLELKRERGKEFDGGSTGENTSLDSDLDLNSSRCSHTSDEDLVEEAVEELPEWLQVCFSMVKEMMSQDRADYLRGPPGNPWKVIDEETDGQEEEPQIQYLETICDIILHNDYISLDEFVDDLRQLLKYHTLHPVDKFRDGIHQDIISWFEDQLSQLAGVQIDLRTY